jgi:hypothetical protein
LKVVLPLLLVLVLALFIACSLWFSGEYHGDELTPEQVDSLEKANEIPPLDSLEVPKENGDPDGESYP